LPCTPSPCDHRPEAPDKYTASRAPSRPPPRSAPPRRPTPVCKSRRRAADPPLFGGATGHSATGWSGSAPRERLGRSGSARTPSQGADTFSSPPQRSRRSRPPHRPSRSIPALPSRRSCSHDSPRRGHRTAPGLPGPSAGTARDRTDPTPGGVLLARRRDPSHPARAVRARRPTRRRHPGCTGRRRVGGSLVAHAPRRMGPPWTTIGRFRRPQRPRPQGPGRCRLTTRS
jgi:hypothetical protein